MVHENEQLRTRGETNLAAQWRDRYENCCQEKEELVEEIKMLQACSRSSENEGTSSVPSLLTGHLMSPNDSFSIERAYMQLKEEYKVSLDHSFSPLRLHTGIPSEGDDFRTRARETKRETQTRTSTRSPSQQRESSSLSFSPLQ